MSTPEGHTLFQDVQPGIKLSYLQDLQRNALLQREEFEEILRLLITAAMERKSSAIFDYGNDFSSYHSKDKETERFLLNGEMVKELRRRGLAVGCKFGKAIVSGWME
jgi:hypothetical protein